MIDVKLVKKISVEIDVKPRKMGAEALFERTVVQKLQF